MGRSMPPCQGGENTGTYAGGESWRGCMPGRATRRWKIIAAATGRKWGQSSCRGHAAPGPLIPSGAHGQGGARNNQPNRYSDQTKTSVLRRTISLHAQAFRLSPATGRAKRQALSTPSTGELPIGSFPVLILTVPNNPIRHSCARSDYNCGATLNCAGMCVHVFSIEFACLRGRWSAPLCKISF
jgi:hypothetical protein